MKAIRVHAPGGPEVLRLEEVPEPVPGPGQVLVKVEAAGVNFIEVYKSLECLAPRGMLVLFGQSSGSVPPFDSQVLNRRGSLFLTRPALQHYLATRAELIERAGDVLGWVRDGKLRPHVSPELPLSRAADAHRELEARSTTGKLLLIPGA